MMGGEKTFKRQFFSADDGRFSPHADLTEKTNYSRHVFIDRDGKAFEVVRLNILDDRHREDIIGFHFAQQYAEIFYGRLEEQPQFYVVGRDNPWDIEYVMHDGSTFCLEICRIADRELLKAIRIENDVSLLMRKSKLKGFEIQKIEKHFPGALPSDLVSKIETKADKQREFPVDVGEQPRLFIRPPMNPRLNLKREVEIALKKKARKKHPGKERTVIVLDNLTTHSEPNEFLRVTEELAEFLDQLPFPSVWVYTGYYSRDDGYDCEYTMIPLKLSEPEKEYFMRKNEDDLVAFSAASSLP